MNLYGAWVQGMGREGPGTRNIGCQENSNSKHFKQAESDTRSYCNDCNGHDFPSTVHSLLGFAELKELRKSHEQYPNSGSKLKSTCSTSHSKI